MKILQCEMRYTCEEAVTHIGSKGYIYCKAHARKRGGYESTRAMRVWEVRLLESGERLPIYEYLGRVAL